MSTVESHDLGNAIMSDLIHIGYHKTGTSWLQQRGFPNVAGVKSTYEELLGLLKALTFDEDATPSIAAISSFVQQIEDPCILSYEALSGGFLFDGWNAQRRTAERLYQALPHAEILIVIRAQPSMLTSVYCQRLYSGGSESPRAFVNGDSSFLSSRLEYDRLVGLYDEVFGSDVVRVELFEDFVQAPLEFLQRIVGSRGRVASIPARRVNPSTTQLGSRLLRWWNALGFPLRGYVRQLVQSGPLSGIGKPISLDVPAGVYDSWSKSNELLSERLGRDLTAVGYP